MHAAALENFIAPHRCEELFTVSEMGIVGNQTGGSRQKGGHAADADMSLVGFCAQRSGQGFAHVGQTDGIVLVDQGLTLQNLRVGGALVEDRPDFGLPAQLTFDLVDSAFLSVAAGARRGGVARHVEHRVGFFDGRVDGVHHLLFVAFYAGHVDQLELLASGHEAVGMRLKREV